MIREYHRAEIGSTSDEARRLLVAGEPTPFVVRADRQSAGRGRGDHAWWSDAGSLTFTIGLDPGSFALPEHLFPPVSLATAVAVIDALETVAAVPRGMLGIRWPNDIEAAGRKLAGILPELVPVGREPRIAIGVGLNLATDLDLAPPEVRGMATSVHALAPGVVDRLGLYRAILELIESRVAALARQDPALPGRWAELDTLRGQTIRVRRGRAIATGQAVGIDHRGWLLLRDDASGHVLPLSGGEIFRGSI